MTDLEKFQTVNACETAEELKDVVLSFCDENGDIKGRTRMFNGIRMANFVYDIVLIQELNSDFLQGNLV